MKLPDFVECYITEWKILPYGIHRADLSMVKERFAITPNRLSLFYKLLYASDLLSHAGCSNLYLNGSYVTEKPDPDDYDVCWDPNGVSQTKLDQIFSENKYRQKEMLGGEFYRTNTVFKETGQTSLDFFQFTREHIQTKVRVPKGIVNIDLSKDSMLNR